MKNSFIEFKKVAELKDATRGSNFKLCKKETMRHPTDNYLEIWKDNQGNTIEKYFSEFMILIEITFRDSEGIGFDLFFGWQRRYKSPTFPRRRKNHCRKRK